ncbi:hypothetical protein [Pseudomonas sp. RW10S2]|uniref:hypothetical protein n=1 Tax=Pseudomonas sp. RW10S2 TaxID=459637 RepID=UPI0016464AD7|nr:hypothetical protein [Pseudomonas sp. RW10S2]
MLSVARLGNGLEAFETVKQKISQLFIEKNIELNQALESITSSKLESTAPHMGDFTQ